jgi:hypothetical protein
MIQVDAEKECVTCRRKKMDHIFEKFRILRSG